MSHRKTALVAALLGLGLSSVVRAEHSWSGQGDVIGTSSPDRALFDGNLFAVNDRPPPSTMGARHPDADERRGGGTASRGGTVYPPADWMGEGFTLGVGRLERGGLDASLAAAEAGAAGAPRPGSGPGPDAVERNRVNAPGSRVPLPEPAGSGLAGSGLLGSGDWPGTCPGSSSPAGNPPAPGALQVRPAQPTVFTPRLRDGFTASWAEFTLANLMRWRNSAPGLERPAMDPGRAAGAIAALGGKAGTAPGNPAPRMGSGSERAYLDQLAGWARQARLWAEESRRALIARDYRRSLYAINRARRFEEAFRSESLRLVVFLERETGLEAERQTRVDPLLGQTLEGRAVVRLVEVEDDFEGAETAFLAARALLLGAGPDGVRRPLTTQAAWEARRALRAAIGRAGEGLEGAFEVETALDGALRGAQKGAPKT